MATLYVGDSQMKYFGRYLPPGPLLRFQSGARVEHLWNIASDIVKDASMIVLHGGTNNMPQDTPAVILRKYQTLVENIRKARPDARIVISGILPRGMSRFPGIKQDPDFINRYNQRAMVVNRALSAISRKVPYVMYIPHPKFCTAKGEVNFELISRDGLHLSPLGVRTLRDDLIAGVTLMRTRTIPTQICRDLEKELEEEQEEVVIVPVVETSEQESVEYRDAVLFNPSAKNDVIIPCTDTTDSHCVDPRYRDAVCEQFQPKRRNLTMEDWPALSSSEKSNDLGKLLQVRHLGSIYLTKSSSTASTNSDTISKNINTNLTLRTRDPGPNDRTVVILFQWMLAKRKHVEKYENFYLHHGFDVLTVQAKPQEILRPKNAQAIATGIIRCLDDKSNYMNQRAFMLHGFSVGGYLIGEFLVKLNNDEPRNQIVSKRLVAQVFDSPVDTDGIPRGFSNVLTTNPSLRKLIKLSLEVFLSTFKKSVYHYENASVAFKENRLGVPSLFLYSKADPVSCPDRIESVIAEFQSRKLPVYSKCWLNSPHVSHFHRHPDEYLDTLTMFLKGCNLLIEKDTDNNSEIENIATEKKTAVSL